MKTKKYMLLVNQSREPHNKQLIKTSNVRKSLTLALTYSIQQNLTDFLVKASISANKYLKVLGSPMTFIKTAENLH